MIFDFRLKVFYTVSQKLSFTKAANELFITQPAVTKHINELEHQLGVALFKRHGNSISLTLPGQVLVRYAEQIFQMYAALENELAEFSAETSGNIRIGASTTLAQYVLPKILALFKSTHPSVQISFFTGNSEQIEQQIIHEKIDVALVEGISHHPQIMYEPFVKDEIVLVTRTNNKLAAKAETKAEQLHTIPLVLREHGSGTLDVVYQALAQINIHPKELNIEIQLENTESIKQYLMHSNCAAFLSIHSITSELHQNQLSILDIKSLDIYRTFQFIQLHGQTNKLVLLFKRFCMSHYNFK
ncbi:LysR substrate-binding domain-containing protein [Xanthocytophaga flava]|uniref:LysR substrate-binding domain-containing protein n=1 Tax=Xanthocytophaga flava TaxID=3048013 RepID=UPI0028D7C7A1|nr:LysR substrate-binding domain-containing protein [Xanthocytophaga flavus]MDJ1472621.1 LysR substrate-binding domain-containing protein [Xanthocytophaga flavus]